MQYKTKYALRRAWNTLIEVTDAPTYVMFLISVCYFAVLPFLDFNGLKSMHSVWVLSGFMLCFVLNPIINFVRYFINYRRLWGEI